MTEWTIEYVDRGFERFYLSLTPVTQAVVEAAISTVLAERGIDAFDGGWGKALGSGLWEFRIQRSLSSISSLGDTEVPTVSGSDRRVSIRIFCTFYGDRIVLLLGGYDKGRDPSPRRQQREIARARAALSRWKRQSGHGR